MVGWMGRRGRCATGLLRESVPRDVRATCLIDRYGRPTGFYSSPSGTPFNARGLDYSEMGTGYHVYRVLD